MATSHALSALRRKYALALGAADTAAMTHLRAVILMFSPDEDFDAIRPAARHAPFRRWYSSILAVLREANGPVSSTQVARRVMALRGVDPADEATLNSIRASAHKALTRLAERGTIQVQGKPQRWSGR